MLLSAIPLRPALLGCAAAGLAAGLAARALGAGGWAEGLWLAGVAPVLAGLLWEIATSLRRGEVGLDIVAALSMSAAAALGEPLAAAVVALMYAGGQYLERFAERRASREMTALLARAPRTAQRRRDGAIEEIAVEDVAVGDVLLVRHGDVAPADGRVAAGLAVLDESALTGEALPVTRRPGEAVRSGAVNRGDPFELLAEKRPADSALAAILRLVETARSARAPMARLADRWSLGFLAPTVAMAGGAWLLSGDPVRAVAVLVVATPCPLILAVPVALVAGLSRAAGRGALVKGGRALEALARVRVLVLDKTGTLTDGRARVVAIHPEPGADAEEILRLAAALDQVSAHPIAEALKAEAEARGLALPPPEATRETPGRGVEGLVEGRAVALGGRDFVAACLGLAPPPEPACAAGAATVAVALDGRLAGEIELADQVRDGAAALLPALRRAGIARIVLATGDRRAVADAVAGPLGLDAVHADLSPEAKVEVVLAERRRGPVLMIGDGVNDAPALAAADVGAAMGVRGVAASAETADMVLLVDSLDPALAALRIARRARAIALQSVAAGIGLSVVGMIAAAAGLLSPVEGALLQEVIDVAVILNALRALGGEGGLSSRGAPDAGPPGAAPERGRARIGV